MYDGDSETASLVVGVADRIGSLIFCSPIIVPTLPASRALSTARPFSRSLKVLLLL